METAQSMDELLEKEALRASKKDSLSKELRRLVEKTKKEMEEAFSESQTSKEKFKLTVDA